MLYFSAEYKGTLGTIYDSGLPVCTVFVPNAFVYYTQFELKVSGECNFARRSYSLKATLNAYVYYIVVVVIIII